MLLRFQELAGWQFGIRPGIGLGLARRKPRVNKLHTKILKMLDVAGDHRELMHGRGCCNQQVHVFLWPPYCFDRRFKPGKGAPDRFVRQQRALGKF